MEKKVAVVNDADRVGRDEYTGSLEAAPSRAFGHAIDGDEALKALGDADGPIHIDEHTNRRLLKKIDRMIMPIMCLVYGLNFLDKTTLSYASITGMPKDIHLVGDNYQWLASNFYIGYLAFEFIAFRLLQRLPLAKYSAFCVISWGVVLACFAAVQNFAGAVAIRLLLGALEASVSPGWTLLTSQWYRKEEQAIRSAWWFSCNGLAQIFGSVVAYGFAHGADTHGYTIAAWRVIYLFAGLLTIVAGLAFLVLVPDNQLNAWWLSADDRRLAVERVRNNQQGIGNKTFKIYQVKEAFTDPAVFAFFFSTAVANIPNGGLTNFFSFLLESFGLDREQSLLYGSVRGAIEIVAILGWAYVSRHYGSRTLNGAICLSIATLGSIILVASPLSATRARLAGLYLTEFYIPGFVCTISLISSNIAGYTKKNVTLGGVFICYAVGNLIGPQTYRPKDAPYYLPAEITFTACFGIDAVVLFLLHWYYRRENAKKKALCSDPSYRKLHNQEFLDLTDRENPEFRYVL